jgi:hypothetical protein
MFFSANDEKRSIIDSGKPEELILKHGRKNLEEVFLKLTRKNEFNRMYGLF